MKVKNQKCIRRLSYKSLWASRKRNVIAIFAIALTTLLFTSLFTILMSLNESYETYNFRQAGGYSDGTFKELSEEPVSYTHLAEANVNPNTRCRDLTDDEVKRISEVIDNTQTVEGDLRREIAMNIKRLQEIG